MRKEGNVLRGERPHVHGRTGKEPDCFLSMNPVVVHGDTGARLIRTLTPLETLEIGQLASP
jgi:hypothetical protein